MMSADSWQADMERMIQSATMVTIQVYPSTKKRRKVWPPFVSRKMPPRKRKSGCGLVLECRWLPDTGYEKKRWLIFVDGSQTPGTARFVLGSFFLL